MVLKVATLAVDVAADRLTRGMLALDSFGRSLEGVVKKTRLGTDSLARLWTAFLLLSNNSSIAAAVMRDFGLAFGYIIDSALVPFLPFIDTVLDALFTFGDWFDQQAPPVKAAALGIGLALAAMWLGVAGPVALVAGAIVALFAMSDWFGDYAPLVRAAAIALGVAFGLMWLGFTGPIGIVVAAIAAALYLIESHTGLFSTALGHLGRFLGNIWDAAVAAVSAAAATIIGWLQALWNALRPVMDGLSWVAGAVGGGLGAVGGFLGGLLGGGRGGATTVNNSTNIGPFNFSGAASSVSGAVGGFLNLFWRQ